MASSSNFGGHASDLSYCCEICGLDSLTEDEFRIHTHSEHVDGQAVCPFCQLGNISPSELLLHVNQAHLDFLTPETEDCNGRNSAAGMMAFIDDGASSPGSLNGECSRDWNLPSSMANHSQHNGHSSNSNSNSSSHSNINNINLSSKHALVNGGGELSPKRLQYGGPGSPLRSNLALKLKSSSPTVQCPMCKYTSSSPTELEEHINRQHFDVTSPSVIGPSCTQQTTTSSSNNFATTITNQATTSSIVHQLFPCPLCTKTFTSPPDLELHVNIEHQDVLSPAAAGAGAPTTPLNGAAVCPVCGIALENDNTESAARHVESHFPSSNTPTTTLSQHSSNSLAHSVAVVANSITSSLTRNSNNSSTSKENQKAREQRDFELLRAQYGMDEQGNFRDQSVTNMQRAVYAGEMSVADYYERTLDLKEAESCGVDDGSSVTRLIVPRVKAMSFHATNVERTLACTCVDHYASSYGDRGWGCGYRNAQMLISSLLTHTGYNERLYKLWKEQKPPRTSVPSISRLQSLIEQAWAQGFDEQGSEQLGCKLVNTRKWIGATEVLTLLSFLRIKCQLMDFHRPTGTSGTHPELFNWVLRHFETSLAGEFTAPLYLQHQGHSRTIMGVEQHRDGTIVLLVLDPSHSPQQMAQFGDTSGGVAGTATALRLLRRGESAMKARQYQIVAVVGMLETEQQYQQSKILKGVRVPQDR